MLMLLLFNIIRTYRSMGRRQIRNWREFRIRCVFNDWIIGIVVGVCDDMVSIVIDSVVIVEEECGGSRSSCPIFARVVILRLVLHVPWSTFQIDFCCRLLFDFIKDESSWDLERRGIRVDMISDGRHCEFWLLESQHAIECWLSTDPLRHCIIIIIISFEGLVSELLLWLLLRLLCSSRWRGVSLFMEEQHSSRTKTPLANLAWLCVWW